MSPIKRKSDKGFYNASSEDFIPVACHYDKNTLLTKNGELLQIFQINGINSEKISNKLFNLRDIVRLSIKNRIESNKFAFWIHTIRRKANLDDDVPYNNLLSGNIHEIWKKKNYWHDKFVNCLYITVIHSAPELKLKNFNSLVNSLAPKIIADYKTKYFSQAVEKLTSTVDKIITDLEEFGAVKLGIRMEEENCFSDPMFLYRRIMQLNEEECLLPLSDISIALSSHQYAVGNDMIEVIDNKGKKFAALLSIKEYQEVSSEALDQFLQIPVEMITTEVFYFVEKNKVLSSFQEQGYIADIGGDAEIKTLNGINKILEDVDSKNKFCHQQISFMVIGDNASQLNSQVQAASETLAKIGIVHVREDINLEKTFWAQLPGNFSFLARMSPTILENTAALASLHNFPTGNQYSPWGKAVTLLRTEKGTPYFLNFHDVNGNTSSCIVGIGKSGKTTLLNFLLSEADKFHPTIIHIVDNLDSGLYIKGKGGRWFQRDKKLINPLLLEDNEKNRAFCFEFFKIIAKHHFDPLEQNALNVLKDLSEKVFSIPKPERKLSLVIELLNESSEGLKKRLKEYTKDGLYYQLFEPDEQIAFKQTDIIAISLEMFNDQEYQKKYYPKEKKLFEEYEYNLNIMRSVKAAIVYSLMQLLTNIGSGPKIFAIDNMGEILNLQYYHSLIAKIVKEMQAHNGIFTSTLNMHILDNLFQQEISLEWLELIGTKFIIPPEIKISNLAKIMDLSPVVEKKLESLTINSRMFLIKQDNKIIASELSIGGLPGIVRFLSSGQRERDIYQEVIKQYASDKPEDWVGPLYDELENI